MSYLYYVIRLVVIYVPLMVTADNCPYQECACIDNTIECSNHNLQTMPSLVMPAVNYSPFLDLSNNNISSVPNGSLPAGLGGLNLENNPLTSIAATAFLGSEKTLSTVILSSLDMDEFPFAFLYLSNLRSLTVTHSRVAHFDMNIFYSLSDTLSSITFIDVGILEWPSWLFNLPHLTYLEFSSVPISIPDYEEYDYNDVLTNLAMKNLSMKSLGGLFSKMRALQYLVLDDNQISDLTGLPATGNLTSLSLVNNSLSDRSNLSQTLSPLANSLFIMNLEGNQFTNFPDLSHMTQLNTLILSHNFISVTLAGSIPSSLNFLELEYNRITSLAMFMGKGDNLKSIHLTSNRVLQLQGADIPASVFTFDVSHNLLTSLDETSFPKNSIMTTLILDSNPISLISNTAFANMPRITDLSLKNTRITRLPMSVTFLESLNTLDLSDNENLVCTCLEKSLRDWLAPQYVEISGTCGRTSIIFFIRTLSVGCPN